MWNALQAPHFGDWELISHTVLAISNDLCPPIDGVDFDDLESVFLIISSMPAELLLDSHNMIPPGHTLGPASSLCSSQCRRSIFINPPFLLLDWNYLISIRSISPTLRISFYNVPRQLYSSFSDELPTILLLFVRFTECCADLIMLPASLVVSTISLLAELSTLRFIDVSFQCFLRLSHLLCSRWFVFSCLVCFTHALPTMDEGASSSGPKCSIFDGVNSSFMPWLIAFSAWVA